MFVLGFVKTAAPRWLKELKKNSSKFKGSVSSHFGSAGSKWGISTEKAINSGNRADIAEQLFGLRPRRFTKEAPLASRSINVGDELPVSHPVRRALYFKADGKTYKQILNIPKEFLDEKTIESLKESGKKAAKYLEGKSRATFQHPFKSLGSRDSIGVKHITTTQAAEHMASGGIKRSPSSGHHAITHKGVFTFPSKSRDHRVFAGTAKQRKDTKGLPSFSVIHSKIPEGDVVYLPPNIRPSKQKDAEIYAGSDAFHRGIRKVKKI